MIQAKEFGSIAKYGFYTLVVELKRYVSTSFILQIRQRDTLSIPQPKFLKIKIAGSGPNQWKILFYGMGFKLVRKCVPHLSQTFVATWEGTAPSVLLALSYHEVIFCWGSHPTCSHAQLQWISCPGLQPVSRHPQISIVLA